MAARPRAYSIFRSRPSGSFADVELLTATYRLAGTIPILGPVACFPGLLAYLNTFILQQVVQQGQPRRVRPSV